MSTAKAHAVKPCGAKARTGEPCKRPGNGRGGRCRFHGGASPAGAESPHWKHGRFSRYKPDHLAEKAASARADPELMDLVRLIADSQAVLDDFMETIRGKHLTPNQRDTFLKLQEHLARLMEMENRRRQALTDTMTLAQARAYGQQWMEISLELARSDAPPADRMRRLRDWVHMMRPGVRPVVGQVIETKAVTA